MTEPIEPTEPTEILRDESGLIHVAPSLDRPGSGGASLRVLAAMRRRRWGLPVGLIILMVGCGVFLAYLGLFLVCLRWVGID